MRILHSSDWHLGRSFHRVDLLSAQAAHLDHLAEVVRAEKVDVVLVAGDIYDRALPAVDAVTLLDEGLHRLVSAGSQVILSSGNHDSARRLGFNSRLLGAAGLHIRTDPAQVGTPVLLSDEHGEVAFHPLPYLEPALAAGVLGAERSHAGVLGAALQRVRADLAERPGLRSVVSAHAFVMGGAASDSERELAVGGLGQVPLALFEGVDYVALGHLHGRQKLAGQARYSGSPLAFSFSEADHHKGSWLVDLDANGLAGVEAVPAPVPRRLGRLRGELAELLTEARFAAHEQEWVQITLTDPQRPAEPMEQLRRRFPHLLELRLDPQRAGRASAAGYTEKIAGLPDLDVCCSFLEHVRGRTASPAETVLLQQALEAALIESMEGAPGSAYRDLAAMAAESPVSDAELQQLLSPKAPGRRGRSA
ncbi:nuclease SbcCD subunit D [Kineosporia sp. NBRC 101677]|uniref:exonuclease SbcCD subunit D n=1 Tax=Kineosporia sp. NBRC 101677 TaxID=3032197 RepID=UPI0024A1FA5B|nr:exonuclease SbcCD subunit D [Kineosporia sp. NBRC 101677]GLY18474.1 nuclease SbcCD subunit D [Kineosporia sp. NBRC 101677]